MSETPNVLTELKLTAEMQDAVSTAFAMRRPIVVAYVDPDGKPRQSYRGSTQAYSETQLAIWVRNPEGTILTAIERNPAVSLVFGYFTPDDRAFMIFAGRARVDESEAVREKVYGNAHEFERSRDPERRGKAVVIDLDSVDGFFGGAALRMRR